MEHTAQEPGASTPPPADDQSPVTASPVTGTPRRRRWFGGARTVIRHRATHVVAAAFLGLVIGAGVTALVAHEEGGEDAGGHGGHSRQYEGHDRNDGGNQQDEGSGDYEGDQRNER